HGLEVLRRPGARRPRPGVRARQRRAAARGAVRHRGATTDGRPLEARRTGPRPRVPPPHPPSGRLRLMSEKGIAVTDELRRYLLDHSIPRSDVHRDLVVATREQMGDRSIMQIAEEQGPFLTFLARMLGARRAIEVG